MGLRQLESPSSAVKSSYYAIGSVLKDIERKYGLSGCFILPVSSTIVFLSQKHQQEQ